MRLRSVTLLLTHHCNLRCKYCYVRDYSGSSMTLETAKNIVREAFAQSEGYDMLEFTLLGGEPFSEFPLIKNLCQWMWSEKWDKEYIISAATNGTLLTDEIKVWLADNKERFIPTLSYDGSESAQRLNRIGSEEKTQLEFFRENWNEPVKMTVTESSVYTMAKDIIRLKERGINVNDTFAGGVPEWSPEALEELDRQLEQLCEYELTHNCLRPSDLLSVSLIPVLYPPTDDKPRCGAGEQRVTYDTDGQKYSCHLLSPLTLSHRETELLRGAIREKQEVCAKCPLDPICPQCDGMAFWKYHRLGIRDSSICGIFRRQVIWACRYQTKRILKKKEPDNEERLTLKAVKKIMREVCISPASDRTYLAEE